MVTTPSSMSSLKMSFIIIWKVVGLFIKLKNITKGSKRPQYHASFQHGITFNFQLHAYPLFKHQLPICPWISIFHPTIIIEQPSSHSHQSTCPIQMTSGPYLRMPLT